jgi:hypothetical protein
MSTITDIPEPSMQLLAEAAQSQSALPDGKEDLNLDQDDRSSSLSDAEDNIATEDMDHDIEKSPELSEEEVDTEAETERLEDSPEKPRVQGRVYLNAIKNIPNGSETSPIGEDLPMVNGAKDLDAEDFDKKDDAHSDILDPTSPMTSLDDSDEGSAPESPSSSSSRKRKRGQDTNNALKRVARQLLANQVGGDGANDDKGPTEFIITSAGGRQITKSSAVLDENTDDSPTNDHESKDQDLEEHIDGADSNEEDVEMEDTAHDLDASTRNEEERK